MVRNNNTGRAVVYILVAIGTIVLSVARTGNGADNVPFKEEWQHTTSDIFSTYVNNRQGMFKSGNDDPDALNGKSLKLTLNPNINVSGVSGAPAAETKSRYKYGTYWARVKTANCSAQHKAGVVTGIFTYFNDGQDHNGNGLPDNSEIDFEFLCAQPEVIHLSIWTDYEESDPPKLRVVYRQINIKTGRILMECYREKFDECRPLNNSERQPTEITAISNYDSSTQYYEYELIYEANRVRFIIVANGVKHTLWDYQGPKERIPGQPMHFMHNVWHTKDWYPGEDTLAVEVPKYQVNAYIDASSFALNN